jgi:outer membrane cobalamin receptor
LGLGLAYIDQRGEGGVGRDQVPWRLDDNDSFGSHVTYRLSPAIILPGTETKLKATYGIGFKAPTLSQLFENFPAFNFFANPNLRPEESVGYDAGFAPDCRRHRLT